MMKQVIWNKCNGEAHSNPMIDHCSVCVPFWGSYPSCPYCGSTRLSRGGRVRVKCRKCNKMVAWSWDGRDEIEQAMIASSGRGDMPEDGEPVMLDTSHVDTVLDHGNITELQTAVDNLIIATERIKIAMNAVDKVTEFENLRTAYEAMKRADITTTAIMFKFVGK